jgi:hypothetical protein
MVLERLPSGKSYLDSEDSAYGDILETFEEGLEVEEVI